MRIVSERALDLFRGPGPCAWCGVWAALRHAAHVLACGMGSGNRLDVGLNLVSLCWRCHRENHDGHRPITADLLALVAAREGVQQAEVEAELYRLRRAPK